MFFELFQNINFVTDFPMSDDNEKSTKYSQKWTIIISEFTIFYLLLKGNSFVSFVHVFTASNLNRNYFEPFIKYTKPKCSTSFYIRDSKLTHWLLNYIGCIRKSFALTFKTLIIRMNQVHTHNSRFFWNLILRWTKIFLF